MKTRYEISISFKPLPADPLIKFPSLMSLCKKALPETLHHGLERS